MEAEALKYVRDEMGLTNVKIMIPFVRTLTEAAGVIDLLAEHGLRRGDNDLQVIMMCEVPSNAVLADRFLDFFDGFSIGSNDMTQLTLGLDRDSALVAAGFDERDPAVLYMLAAAITRVQSPRQIRRHLRARPQRPPRPRPMATRTTHRHHVPQPRHRRRNLDSTGYPNGQHSIEDRHGMKQPGAR